MNRGLFIFLLFCCSTLCSQSTLPDSLQRFYKNLTGPERYHKQYGLAEAYMDIHLPTSFQLAKEAISIAKSLKADSLVFASAMQLGEIGLRLPNHHYADSIFHEALSIALKMDDPSRIKQAKHGLSDLYSQQGKWTEAHRLLDEIIESAIAHEDSAAMAKALMRKGVNYEKTGYYAKAISYYYQSKAIHQARGDEFRVGVTLTNIGMALMEMKRHDEALEQFQIALEISKRLDDQEGVMINTLDMGVAYQKMGQLDKAREAFLQTLNTAKALGSWQDIALCFANLGTIALKQGDYTFAKTSLERSYAIKDSLGTLSSTPHTLNSLSEVHLQLGNLDTAMAKALLARSRSIQFDNKAQLSESYRATAKIHAAQKNYAAAYEDMIRHKQLSDSLFNAESDEVISNLKIEHETELKENRIDHLTAVHKRTTTAKFIFLGIGLLVLLTGASLVYALVIKRRHDKLLLDNERELHELQNRFFANISHEFRTPLTLILGPVHKLREKLKNTKEEVNLKIIQKNAERLLQLINQILDLVKFDKDALQLKQEYFNATTMVQGIASSFDSLAESRSIAFSYDVPERIFLQGDKRRLEIVLTNLISNAFKFTPDHGSIQITSGVNENDKTFSMEVLDSGTGIEEENLGKVFDRYFHDDRQAHSDFEGAGIGLALSKHIVEMHEGSISVASRAGHGSLFKVILPYHPIPEKEKELLLEDVPTSVESELILEPAGFENQNDKNSHLPILLLVEDRKDMRQYIASLLYKQYHVLEAADAFDGFTQAAEHIPDIVISDVMMPGKNGLELCRELKTDIRTSHIPVILLTAKSSTEDRLSGLETEADIYLTKPFIPEELELHLRNLIASRKRLKDFYQQHRRIEPSKMAFNSMDEKFLEAIIQHLETNYQDENFSVEQLASLMALSRSQLHRKLIALTGQVPNRLIRTYRLKKAFDMVSNHVASIAEIGYKVGFNSPAYFTKCFEEEFGHTPSEIRNRAINA